MPRCATLILLILLSPSPSAHGQARESGRIEGIVVRAGSSEPVSGVSIILRKKATAEQTEAFFKWTAGRGPAPKDGGILAHDGTSVVLDLPADLTVRPVTTDSAGRFSIEGLPEGTYAVNARREGFFGRGTDPETPGFFDGAAMFDMVFVTIERGKTATASLELTPGAVISGRVTGAQGVPLAGQDVRAFRAHRQGEETILRGVTLTQTDDRGQYRLHTLPPGEYFVASGLGFPEMGDGDPDKIIQKPVPGERVRRLTFHPSTLNAEMAPPIPVTGGEDIANKDIEVQTERAIRISGEVIADSGLSGVSSASVQLLPRSRKWRIDRDVDNDGVLAFTSATFAASTRGKFEFVDAFLPGTYEVRATIETSTPRKAGGSAHVDVGLENIDGVVIVLKGATR